MQSARYVIKQRFRQQVLLKERYRAFGIPSLYVIVGLLAVFPRFGGMSPESTFPGHNDVDYNSAGSFLFRFPVPFFSPEEFVLSVS